MRIDDIPFTLKDGRRAVLRNARDGDIGGMLAYLSLSAGETDFILRYPEECGKYTPEGEAALFARVNASPTEAMLVCDVEGTIAGNCQVSFNERIKTRHRGEIGIALLKAYWGQGIGTRMFAQMERIARTRPGVRQLELFCMQGNARARGLYEKMGFRVAGIHPDAICLKDGTLLDEYLMTKRL